MRYLKPFIRSFICLILPLLGQAAQLPPGFVETQIATGLDPTTLAVAPDGRVFIAEKNGRIRLVENGALLPDPFLSIAVDNYNERGLSGLALDPDFELNHYCYVFYTVPGGNYNRISRFTANGNYALPDSEEVLMELTPLAGSIHNGGAMAFGNDGQLYIAVGDGANPETGQDLNTTLGKILRINKDGSIPEDNPFYEQLSGQARAIYAYGFRNPFTMAIDPVSGAIFANDVGSDRYEEVNQVLRGGNYGWPLQEGMGSPPFPSQYQAPRHAYNHDVGCAVIGATFCRSAQQHFPPEYTGRYFFADYCNGTIWTLAPGTSEQPEVFATGINRPVALHFAPDGSLYYLERRGLGGGSQTDNTSSSDGVLWKVSYTGSGLPFVSAQPQPLLRAVGETANFYCAASGAPPLAYQWQKDGEDIPGATAAQLDYPEVGLADDGSLFRCRISNAEGEVFTQTALLSVTANTRPLPQILLPSAGSTYRAGDVLTFEGMADDAEDGALPEGQLSWRIDFHHDDHTHPGMAPQVGDSGSFAIPSIGETSSNVWYRIHLTATDSEGLSQSVYRDVLPEKRDLQLQTQPPGLQVRLDGRTLDSPHTEQAVVGVIRSLRAPDSQVKDGQFYVFDRWAEVGGNPLLSFAMPDSNTTFTAQYQEVQLGTGTGLTGAYYDEVLHEFEGDPDFWRIDATIDFQWGAGSPAASLVGNDFFNIRWTGAVEPLFTEVYTFYTLTDDGVRLWVDEQLIVDQWVPQAATEHSGSIALQAGRRYAIRLEYFEDAGEAECRLFWSSARTPKQIVPQSQLYPDQPTSAQQPAIFGRIHLYPQPARELLSVFIEQPGQERIQARLLRANGQEVWRGLLQHQGPSSLHQLPLNGLPSGLYSLVMSNAKGVVARKVMVVD